MLTKKTGPTDMKTLYTLGYNKTVINLTEAKKTQDYPDGVWRADL